MAKFIIKICMIIISVKKSGAAPESCGVLRSIGDTEMEHVMLAQNTITKPSRKLQRQEPLFVKNLHKPWDLGVSFADPLYIRIPRYQEVHFRFPFESLQPISVFLVVPFVITKDSTRPSKGQFLCILPSQMKRFVRKS